MARRRMGVRSPRGDPRPSRRLRHRLGAARAVAAGRCGAVAGREGREQAPRRRPLRRERSPRRLAGRPARSPGGARARACRRDRARRGRRPQGRPRPVRAAVVERPPLRPARDLRARPYLRGDPTDLLVGTDLADHASGWIAGRAGTGEFRIALTGGSMVGRVYEQLAQRDLDWPNWHVWWSDERDVPPDSELSNEKLARDTLLSKVAIPEEQVHPLRSADVELPERFDLI